MENDAQDWSGFVPSEPRVQVRDGQQRRVRVARLRNIKARPLGVTKRHIWVFDSLSVKSRKYKSGDNLALLGPSLMFHAFCARFATKEN